MKTVTYKDIIKCETNPSVELPKYIKKRLGTTRDISFITVDDVIYIAIHPHEFSVKGEKFIKKEAGITVIKLFSAVTVNGHKNPIYLVTKKGSVLKNITQDFIEGYQKYGMCYYLDDKHDFKQLSPRIKQCNYCNKKFKQKVVITKTVDWQAIT